MFFYHVTKVSKLLNINERNYKIAQKGENKTMQKNINDPKSRLGIRLTKKRAIYLTVLSSIGSSYFACAIFFAVPVLYYARTNIYPDDKFTYFYTLLLSISNFIASAICIAIFSYTLSKVKTFRKSVKKQ